MKPQCEYSEKRLWFYDITFPPALCVSISPLLSSPLGLNLFRSVPPAGHDFCSEGHSCMEHSDCVNLEAGDCCVCKDGFRPLRDDNAYCEGRAKPWLLGEVYGLWKSGCGFTFVNMPKLHYGGHKRALVFFCFFGGCGSFNSALFLHWSIYSCHGTLTAWSQPGLIQFCDMNSKIRRVSSPDMLHHQKRITEK